MIPFTLDILLKIEKNVYNLLWGKRDRIRRRSIICSQNNGGLNMIDIESYFLALKASWIGKIKDNQKPCSFLGNHFMKKIAPLNLLCQMSFEDLKEMPCLTQIPLFYQQVLLGHCKSKTQPPVTTRNDILNQLLWGNHLLKCDSKCLYSNSMISSNFLYVKDILNIDGSYKQNIFQRLVVKSQYF